MLSSVNDILSRVPPLGQWGMGQKLVRPERVVWFGVE